MTVSTVTAAPAARANPSRASRISFFMAHAPRQRSAINAATPGCCLWSAADRNQRASCYCWPIMRSSQIFLLLCAGGRPGHARAHRRKIPSPCLRRGKDRLHGRWLSDRQRARRRRRLIARGRNRRVQEGDPIAHGEMDCLRRAGRQKSCRKMTLYTSLSPCMMRTGTILQFAIPCHCRRSRKFSRQARPPAPAWR